jgi:hypothetical protein
MVCPGYVACPCVGHSVGRARQKVGWPWPFLQCGQCMGWPSNGLGWAGHVLVNPRAGLAISWAGHGLSCPLNGLAMGWSDHGLSWPQFGLGMGWPRRDLRLP